jgi:hypothetical protein
LVQEVEAQIAQNQAALASAETSKLHDETTDRDPTYEWTREELAKANSGSGWLAGEGDSYGSGRAEENYLLSLRKAEEARISDGA